jgi:hypothetical protein
MNLEGSDDKAYLSPTAPEWAHYYKRAKALRRLGKGQHARIQTESKRRRRRANILLALSTSVLVAAVTAFCLLLGN